MAARNRFHPAAPETNGWATEPIGQVSETANATVTPRGGSIVTFARSVPVLPSSPSDLASYGPPVTKQWVASHPMAHVSSLPQDVFWRFGMGWDGEFVFSMLEPWEALACSTFMLVLAVLLIHSFTYLPGTLSYLVHRGIYYATGTEN